MICENENCGASLKELIHAESPLPYLDGSYFCSHDCAISYKTSLKSGARSLDLFGDVVAEEECDAEIEERFYPIDPNSTLSSPFVPDSLKCCKCDSSLILKTGENIGWKCSVDSCDYNNETTIKRALFDIFRAIKKDSKNGNAWKNAVIAFLAKGEKRAALSSFVEAIILGQNFDVTELFQLGILGLSPDLTDGETPF